MARQIRNGEMILHFTPAEYTNDPNRISLPPIGRKEPRCVEGRRKVEEIGWAPVVLEEASTLLVTEAMRRAVVLRIYFLEINEGGYNVEISH